MVSAAETKIGVAYENSKEEIPLSNEAIEMGHPQTPTQMQVKKSMVVGFFNKTIKQKLSKSIDMRFYWLQDREAQE